MTGMVLVVWGGALLALLCLGAVLIWTLRSGERSAKEDLEADTDTLLLYYEEQSVRRTPRGDVVLRIPGMAWEREWQDDLVRLDVVRIAPGEVEAPEEWGEARVLAAYELRAHRMTEIGTDRRLFDQREREQGAALWRARRKPVETGASGRSAARGARAGGTLSRAGVGRRLDLATAPGLPGADAAQIALGGHKPRPYERRA
jgi:hypothetical protein